MIPNPELLIGKRFATDLRVVAIAPGWLGPLDGSRVVTVHMHGDKAEISLEELSTMIEVGLLIEMPERGV